MKNAMLPLLVLGLAAACSGDTPAAPRTTGSPLLSASAAPNAVTYDAVGDCQAPVVIDPGTVTVVGDVRLERGLTADCVLTGDVAGVIRFIRSSTVRNASAPPTEWVGPAWGTTIITVKAFFGRTDLTGTFEGPFRTDWQNLLFGEVKLNRRGTGDFQGMTLVGTGTAAPGSLGRIILEHGVIHEP
jgi:hypothetical protein